MPPTSAVKCSMSVVFPTPGSPAIQTTWRLPARASCHAARSRSSASERPINDEGLSGGTARDIAAAGFVPTSMGGALTLSQMTENTIPYWMGGLLVCGVVLIYVLYGGMRSTAWVNSFQTLVFIFCGAATLVVILKSLGGLDAALDTVQQKRPDLLIRGEHIAPAEMFSYMFIPLSAGMFPHLFNHWLTARRAETFRITLIVYPMAITAVCVPSVLLAV